MSEQLRLTDETLPAYLEARGIVPTGTQLSVEPAGDGNINWVRRTRSADGRSWIVKQARPALEAFPQYEAPTERIIFEHRWLELAPRVGSARESWTSMNTNAFSRWRIWAVPSASTPPSPAAPT